LNFSQHDFQRVKRESEQSKSVSSAVVEVSTPEMANPKPLVFFAGLAAVFGSSVHSMLNIVHKIHQTIAK
jgi:hypothetical protein